ncbi:LacI family transcriptional regulator [Rathayibacter rathayi]|uniref:LacI family transcriptional regulator n=2 Tax=Rathayibacter rathayi TaxID=33887 RepID=A0ABX5A7P4_RATRA|nr:LacI family transcriptional regulator [Rathayibacter rathayi]PPG64883.1 LacI family transcriptional regulator [Rathayibacter rathayi]PPG73880.1 LacI family transcriptional regulator [Rathayibacter rathayi]PPG86599.1 LacI family transcriptional regulator [Rathayibacter rathayi]PPG90090.1 LacI family transcriptional regulator [Rathayibacter rathayi]
MREAFARVNHGRAARARGGAVATMRDVARLAGVSIATVSFVVNDTKPVSPETRERVQAAMREFGFRPHALARALARRRSGIVAVVYPLVSSRPLTTATSFLLGAAEAAAEQDHSIVLWPTVGGSERLADLRADGLIDGVVLMQVTSEDERVPILRDSGTPFALIGRTRDPSALDWVDIDFEGMVAEALGRLAGLGHARVALVLGPDRDVTGFGPYVRTQEAFSLACAARGLEGVLLRCEESPAGGRALARSFDPAAATAAVIVNGGAAVGFAHELRHRGLRVPVDLSIVLLASDTDVADLADPALDLLVAPGRELGRRGVEALLARLADPDAPLLQERIGGPWRAGGSLAPPAALT